MREDYEAVIGLEVHIQLLTKTKAYSSDPNEYGAMPNTNVSVVTLGHPGTLPVVNEKVIEYAVKLGLAVGADIREENQYARKNYFYADLPKGYQITQDKTPICSGGAILIKHKSGEEKSIGITRIHMEEDAGKSIHDVDPFHTLVDLNRAGVPLLEMVSEPDLRTSDDAYQYLTEVRKLVRYLEICDGNLEEGSMRCDANISVRKKGAAQFGTKIEVKNMNSIRNVQRAIEHEIERQIKVLDNGGMLYQETRSFDAVNGTTFSMRSKESANDYRYFPEPDLPPVYVSEEYIAEIKEQMPALPQELHKRFIKDFGLSEYDASIIIDTKEIALYFDELSKHTQNYKAAANWLMGGIKSYLNENGMEINKFPIPATAIADLISIIDAGKISNSIASQKVFPAMIENPDEAPLAIAQRLNVLQESNQDQLQEWVLLAINKYPEKVKEYQSGKKGLMGLFIGEVMKLSAGKADPKALNKLMQEALEQI